MNFIGMTFVVMLTCLINLWKTLSKESFPNLSQIRTPSGITSGHLSIPSNDKRRYAAIIAMMTLCALLSCLGLVYMLCLMQADRVHNVLGHTLFSKLIQDKYNQNVLFWFGSVFCVLSAVGWYAFNLEIGIFIWCMYGRYNSLERELDEVKKRRRISPLLLESWRKNFGQAIVFMSEYNRSHGFKLTFKLVSYLVAFIAVSYQVFRNEAGVGRVIGMTLPYFITSVAILTLPSAIVNSKVRMNTVTSMTFFSKQCFTKPALSLG